MEKKIFLLVTTILLCLNLHSQTTLSTQPGCGTPEPTKEQIKYTLDIVNQISTVRSGNSIALPIRFHVVRRNDGSGGIPTRELNKAVGSLNTYFQPIDLQFFIADINFIDDANYFALNLDNEIEPLSDTYLVDDAVNIFMVDRVTKNGYDFCGYTYFPSDDANSLRMFMANGCTNDGISANFPHEFGHFFNLYHTFRGTYLGADDPNAECVARSGSESNCSTHGDLICDTDADPKGYVNGSCNYLGNETDLFGQAFTPPIGNVMTYYHKKCGATFTNGQYDRMHQGLMMRLSYDTYDIDGAQYSEVANPTDLRATVGPDYTIALDWKDNSDNETGFLIERSEDNGVTFSPIMEGGTESNTTTYLDAAVESNKQYVYRIKASNDNPTHYSNTTGVESSLVYCLPEYQQNSCELLDVGAGIQRFNLGGQDNLINKNSECNGPYSVYTMDTPPGIINTGVAYPFTVDFMQVDGVHVPQNVSIWADLNQDGSFDNSVELLYKSNFGFTGPSSATGSIILPCNTLTGKTTLRIRTLYLPMGMVEDPCKLYHFGEAEDYAIEIKAGQAEFAAVAVSEYSGANPNDGIICSNATVNLIASGGMNYAWEDGSLGPYRTVQGAGTYTVTVTNVQGCEDVETVTITTESTIDGSIETTGSDSMCQGEEVRLEAKGGDTYKWDDGSTIADRVVTESGIYTVTISDNGGCTAVESITVAFEEAVNADILVAETSGLTNNDGQICQGDVATITATGGSTFRWEDGSTNATRSITNTGTYTVTVTSEAGCTAVESVDIAVSEVASATLLANGQEVDDVLELCRGDVVEIVSNGQSILWEDGSTNPKRYISESGTITATVITPNGCESIATLEVIVRDFVNAQVIVTDKSGLTENDGLICQGDTAELIASGGTTYTWEDGSTNSHRVVDQAGFYTVVVTDDFGCTAAASIELSLDSPEVPTILIDEKSGNQHNDGVFCQGESVTLSVNGGVNIAWENGSVGNTRVINKSGVYSVTSTSNQGCTVSESVKLTELQAPEVTISIENASNPEANYLSYGDTARLIAQGADNYTWSTGDTSSEIEVDSDGIYAVSTIDENSCIGETFTYVAFSLILSIDGLEVDAYANDGYNTIDWTLPSDDNIESYEVQRKVGSENFTAIAQVSSERSQLDPYYSVNDEDLTVSGSHYYRIKTIDQVGNVDYSDIVVVNTVIKEVEQADDMRIYPNPSRGLINIDLPKYADQECAVTLNVRDEMGSLVYTEVLAGEQYAEVETYQVNLAGVAQGMYFVEILRCNSRDIQRLMITE